MLITSILIFAFAVWLQGIHCQPPKGNITDGPNEITGKDIKELFLRHYGSGIEGKGTKFQRYIKAGDTLDISCNGTDSNELFFEHGRTGRIYNTSSTDRIYNTTWTYVKILNGKTIALEVENMQPVINDQYYCKNKTVPLTQTFVSVDFPPQNVTNFQCHSYNRETMTCSFGKSPNNILRINYYLTYIDNGETIMHDNFSCSIDGSQNCSVELSRYNKTILLYNFNLTSENRFGNHTEKFKIDNMNSVIPGAVTDMELLNITSDSAVLTYKIPFSMQDFPKSLRHTITIKSLTYPDDSKPIVFDREPQSSPTIVQKLPLKFAYAKYKVTVQLKVVGTNYNGDLSNVEGKTFNASAKVPALPKSYNGLFYFTPDMNMTAVTIYWQNLNESQYNGPDFRYNIYFLNNTYEVTTSAATFTNLLNINEDLKFTILAVNRIGNSNPTELIVPYKSKRVSSPEIFVVKEDQGYQVSWTTPINTDNIIMNFTLLLCASVSSKSEKCNTESSFKIVSVPANETTYYHYNNNETIKINVAVSANSENQSSGMVWAECRPNFNESVGKLKGFQVDNINNEYMEILLDQDCTDKILISGYNITYCPVQHENGSCIGAENAISLKNTRAHKYQHKLNTTLIGWYKFTIYGFSSYKVGPAYTKYFELTGPKKASVWIWVILVVISLVGFVSMVWIVFKIKQKIEKIKEKRKDIGINIPEELEKLRIAEIESKTPTINNNNFDNQDNMVIMNITNSIAYKPFGKQEAALSDNMPYAAAIEESNTLNIPVPLNSGYMTHEAAMEASKRYNIRKSSSSEQDIDDQDYEENSEQNDEEANAEQDHESVDEEEAQPILKEKPLPVVVECNYISSEQPKSRKSNAQYK